MQDVLMVGKDNSCNVSKPAVHVMLSNFVTDILEIWNAMLIFRMKTEDRVKQVEKLKDYFHRR